MHTVTTIEGRNQTKLAFESQAQAMRAVEDFIVRVGDRCVAWKVRVDGPDGAFDMTSGEWRGLEDDWRREKESGDLWADRVRFFAGMRTSKEWDKAVEDWRRTQVGTLEIE